MLNLQGMNMLECTHCKAPETLVTRMYGKQPAEDHVAHVNVEVHSTTLNSLLSVILYSIVCIRRVTHHLWKRVKEAT